MTTPTTKPAETRAPVELVTALKLAHDAAVAAADACGTDALDEIVTLTWRAYSAAHTTRLDPPAPYVAVDSCGNWLLSD